MTSRPKPTSSVGRSQNYEMNNFGGSAYTKDGAYPPPHRSSSLPVHQNQKVTKGVKAEGESGRKGIHPLKFLRICFRSSCTLSKFVNLLWPFVPAAFALKYATHKHPSPNQETWVFILSYIAMLPCANLLGFAGQEVGRKLPHALGVLMETTFGSVVEIILFMILVSRGETFIPVIKAAILGSILANLLLCLGLCFFAGGLRREEQDFHEAVSEVGSNLMLVAGMALILPAVFSTALTGGARPIDVPKTVLRISRASAIILLVAYLVYVWYQMRTHKGIYEHVLHGDEQKDNDRVRDFYKAKLTMSEAILALVISITFVTFMAVFLVDGIENIVHHHHIKDAFVGLILIPVVEKAAEHITAVDEAWDDQMNFALSHVLGSSIQTALFNTPLVMIVAWGLKVDLDLNFEIFDAVVLILAILVVGNFLRDGKSNYLEGVLCVLVYVIIAICAFYYPDPPKPEAAASH